MSLHYKVVEACKTMKPVRQVYQELVNIDEGGPRHVVSTPRNQVQVCIDYINTCTLINLYHYMCTLTLFSYRALWFFATLSSMYYTCVMYMYFM